MKTLNEQVVCSRRCSAELANAFPAKKNKALFAIAQGIEDHIGDIIAANNRDVLSAQQSGMNMAMIDRLRLTDERIRQCADAVRQIAALPDPVGQVLDGHIAPNGLQITRVSVPLGVVGIIYESRPNVTVDCAALCLKSGNTCILRGGKEAIHSNKALVEIMQEALAECRFSPDCIQLVEDTTRSSATEMMKMHGLIDVLIPRGGPSLIEEVVQNATVPVIETGVGNCHIYVDASASLSMAVDIVDNAKTSRPSVCNAVETLLVHESCAGEFLPRLARRLENSRVQLRGCSRTCAILGKDVKLAKEIDYVTEFGDYILAVKVVESLDEAINHIEWYSTHHSESIITQDMKNSREFIKRVNSAAVYVNASTRFTDGSEFGLGAEIGISTQKLHARGPMGLVHLTSSKYVILGDGQIRV